MIVRCVLACCLCIGSAAAQELALLKRMPPDLLRYTGGARPDECGLVAHNKGGFKSPEFQRGAMHYMIRAIVRGNQCDVADAWRAIDATMHWQNDSGSFSQPGRPYGGPSAAAFWLADLSQAMLVLRESDLAPTFADRSEPLMPKIRRLGLWLAQPRYRNRLKTDDADAPNRLLFDALAFGLSGKLLGDNDLQQHGREFVDLAMTKYRPKDGVFLEKGGHDSSYQAVSALKLQVWLVHFPDDKLNEAVDRAVAWQVSRVGPDGRINTAGNTRTGLGQEQWMGHPKDVNLSEITLCLLYHYARTGNEQSLAAAQRIVASRKQQ